MRRYLVFALCIMAIETKAQVKYVSTINWGINIGFDNYYNDWSGEQDLYESDPFMGVKLDYIGSAQLNNKIAVGLGVGFRHLLTADYVIFGDYLESSSNNNRRNRFQAPVFTHLKIRFIDKKVSPFLALSAGYSFSLQQRDELESSLYRQSGVMGNANAGVNIRLKKGKSIAGGPLVEVTSYRATNSYKEVLSKSNYQIWQIGFQASFAF